MVKSNSDKGISILAGVMAKTERYLEFGNLDLRSNQTIIAACSSCGRTFLGNLNPGERVDEVLLRMRSEFEDHSCHENAGTD
jgi:hypothetical protein